MLAILGYLPRRKHCVLALGLLPYEQIGGHYVNTHYVHIFIAYDFVSKTDSSWQF